ncbi:hypothetical protein RM533_09870 [Croceicoccus sp. F390]|uniref:Uncharacterized protein n=1 Tax=Croceicoccus esteveae TaxID=3075597 RepID=A0ABU2ZLP1_9SPHN|nr:hypothetical protein [Croceicoccus sp. F390]MDT0576494.1 hypothetical protein [Croceicoccus sp. F390]
MGRNERYGAGYEIQNAEKLFLQSVTDNAPDYKYVALAIGVRPARPPAWAMLACIELRQREEVTAARGSLTDVPFILDELIRFYLRKQREFENRPEYVSDDLDNYSLPPLRSAILHVLQENGLRGAEGGTADDNWHRDIRNAWDWEQERDFIVDADPACEMRLDGFLKSKGKRVPIKTTSRIQRVLMQAMAQENDDPVDLHYWAWITKQAVEHGNIERQRPPKPDAEETSDNLE